MMRTSDERRNEFILDLTNPLIGDVFQNIFLKHGIKALKEEYQNELMSDLIAEEREYRAFVRRLNKVPRQNVREDITF